MLLAFVLLTACSQPPEQNVAEQSLVNLGNDVGATDEEIAETMRATRDCDRPLPPAASIDQIRSRRAARCRVDEINALPPIEKQGPPSPASSAEYRDATRDFIRESEQRDLERRIEALELDRR